MNSIRERRKELGLSQAKLAERANCSLSYVRMIDYGYIPGASSPTYQRIVKVLEKEEKA